MGHPTRMLLAALVLALMQHQAAADGTQQFLADLAAKINQARTSPRGVSAAFSCPKDLERLVGTSIATINIMLPKADLSHEESQSYFLTGPRPPGQRGGGFPEITFHFNRAGTVEGTTCNRSK